MYQYKIHNFQNPLPPNPTVKNYLLTPQNRNFPRKNAENVSNQSTENSSLKDTVFRMVDLYVSDHYVHEYVTLLETVD